MASENARTGRRERGRAREAAGAIAPLPRLVNRMPPVEILSREAVERVVAAAYRVLEEAGLELMQDEARAVLQAAGALVDEAGIVRIGRDIVEAALTSVAPEFVLYARNPARHLQVGGSVVNFGPVNGAPHIADRDGGRRYGDLAAFRDVLKVTNGLGVVHWQGGVVVEPTDVPVPLRHLAMYKAHIELADIVWAARGVGGVQATDALALSAIEHGCSVEELAKRPTLMTVTNVNSPRRVDGEILDNILALAKAGQAIVITPFTLMGAMAPVTLGGALVQQTAEALGIITLVQLVRPGCPVVMGGFTSNVDMKTGSPAFGTPEYVNATLATAQIGRRLGVPVRTSSVNASPAVDAQSTYETAFSLWAAIASHSHLINHAAGWLEGGLTASFEKMVVDAEMLRGWAEILKPVEFSDDDLAVDAILSVPPGGHHFGTDHTLARYQTAFYRPLLSDWSNFENWTDAGAKDATVRASEIWRKVRDEYVPPPLDAAIREAMEAYIAKRTEEIGKGA